MSHLRERSDYELEYDRRTVEECRSGERIVNGTFSELEQNDNAATNLKEHAAGWYIQYSHLYFQHVESVAYLRFKNKEDAIQTWLDKDEAADQKLVTSQLEGNPYCTRCGKSLALISRDYVSRRKYDTDVYEESILFMLECKSCKKRAAFWEDGSEWEGAKTYCKQCNSEMSHAAKEKDDAIVTVFSCSQCSYNYKDVFKLNQSVIGQEKSVDRYFELDQKRFCFDEGTAVRYEQKLNHFMRVAKLHLDADDRVEHKETFDAIRDIKQLKIAQLADLLTPLIQKEDFDGLKLGEPQFGTETFVPFSCLDGRADRSEYDSRQSLKHLIDQALEDTNWRLMSDGINVRLGYLSGRLRAYEKEEDLRKLVERADKKTDQLKEHPVTMNHSFDFKALTFNLKREVALVYFDNMTFGGGDKAKKIEPKLSAELNPNFRVIIPMRENDNSVPKFIRNFNFRLSSGEK